MARVIDPFCNRNKTQPIAEDEQEQIYAKMLGGKAHLGSDGSVIFQQEVGRWQRPFTVKYGSREAAQYGMREALENIESRTRFQNRMESDAQARYIEVPDYSTLEDVDPVLRAQVAKAGVTIDQGQPKGPITLVKKWLGQEPRLDPHAFSTVEGNGARMGELGDQSVSMLHGNRDMQNRLEADANLTMDSALKLLDDYDRRMGFQQWREHGIVTDPTKVEKYEQAHELLIAFKDRLYKAAQDAGIDVKEKLDNYFPRVFDWSRWMDPAVEERVIAKLIKRGVVPDRAGANKWIEDAGYGWSRDRAVEHVMTDKSITKQEALRELFGKHDSSMMNKALDRRSGHLESDRLGMPGYVTNVEIAYRTAFSRDIRRISEVLNFGLHDEKMTGVLDEIGEQVSPAAKAYMEQAFAIETGKNRLDFTKLPTFWRHLYDWQAAKLSLSFFANLAQPLNAGIRGGFWNMAKALAEVPGGLIGEGGLKRLEYLEQRGEKGARYFRESGFLSGGKARTARVLNGILDDVSENGLSRLDDVLPSKFMQTKNFATNMLSYVFNVSELFVNRYVSSRVGEMFFEQEAEAFARGLGKRSVLASSRLREMGFDAERVVAAMRADPEAFAEMRTNAAQVFNRQTQFKGDTLSLPLWASKGGVGHQGELMRMMLQFKTFPISQGRFIVRELSAFQRGDVARSVRAVSALTTAFPVLGYGLAKTRSQLMGNTVTTDMLDHELNNPTVFNLLAAGLTSSMMLGSVGIMGDMVGSSWAGNKFSAVGMFVPPVGDSMLNLADIARSTVQGAYMGDRKLLNHAVKQVGREMGGIGAAVTHKLGYK